MAVEKETMIKMKKQMAEKILNHALGIIYLLTGEEYVIVKKNSPHRTTHLLTGEIPVKCGDISIYFSMEEWDYIEEHKDHYQNMVLEEEISVDRCSGPHKNGFDVVFLGEEELREKNTGDVNFCKETKPDKSGSLAEDSHKGSQGASVDDESNRSQGGNSSIASSACDTGSHTSSGPRWEREKWTVDDNIISKDASKKKTQTQDKKNTSFVSGAPKDVTLNGTKIPRMTHLSEHCGRCLVGRSHLVRHKRRHPMGQEFFSCKLCGKHFALKSHLIAHQRSHNGETCYWCGDCGIFYTYKSQLIAHLRTHREDQFYRCDVCDQKFDFRCLLLVHQQIHTGQKPHQCYKCGERFTYKSSLAVHERTHTAEKPHGCKDCGEHFSDGYSLITHQKVHGMEAPHKCPDCGKQFEYKATLIVHQRTHRLVRQQKRPVEPKSGPP